MLYNDIYSAETNKNKNAETIPQNIQNKHLNSRVFKIAGAIIGCAGLAGLMAQANSFISGALIVGGVFMIGRGFVVSRRASTPISSTPGVPRSKGIITAQMLKDVEEFNKLNRELENLHDDADRIR